MGLEIEAKVKVDSHAATRARLAELGATCTSNVLESNCIFDRPDDSLLAKGCGLRVRHCEALTGQAPAPTVTYKGPRLASELKLREEINVTVDDADQATAMLEALGFRRVLHFEKRRESWRLDDCAIELDTVPHLGSYVEIEGPDESSVRRAQERLGFGGQEMIRDSYIALLVDYCRERDLPTSCITFEQAGEA